MSDVNELHRAAYERYLRAKNRSENTIASYDNTLRMLEDDTGAPDIAELDKAELESWMGRLLERYASASCALHYRNIHAFYAWCVDEEIIDVSPMRRMEQPTVTDTPPPVVPDEQIKALLKTCAGRTYEDRRDAAILRLWCEPGSPRLAEMAGIRKEDLDMRAGMVTLHGKGNKIRTIPFGSKTGTALDRFLRVRARHPRAQDDRLWLSSEQGRGQGHAITPSGLTQMLRRRCDRAGIDRIHPHQFRHTSAHVWADSGGSESDAMILFGWASREMPIRYGRSARTERAHRAAKRISPADRL